MEEIKLPKFKTKEELEQFAMGLMTENESLKKVLTLKCESIKVLNGQLDSFFAIRTENQIKGEKIRALESELESLKEKTDEEYYKKLYKKEHRGHIATKIAYSCSEFELNKIKRKVHKLCSMVTYMAGLLPRFKVKRVKNVFGDFNIEDYRL